ncbi:hypothetical protein SLEP1_g53311 [Rubroshorea leprosula]|uniref:Uncharacterized protein n=1 Tax=Rubroshorea leprosula TaxID=152421 RepID=A0AAV5M918_9ROSI|nr:hypothetical protein SLEP1_g53311 [Rubroshorea leprosula]
MEFVLVNWSWCLVGTLGGLATLVEGEVEVVEHGAAAPLAAAAV